MKRLAAMTACATLVAWVAVQPARPGEPAKGGKGKDLVGTYKIVADERDGKKTPEEHFKGATVRITEDTITATDKDKKDLYATKYQLDTSKTPWQITMTSILPVKGEVSKGLIKREGDTVTLVYALPGGQTPTTFSTKEKQNMVTLDRVKE